MVPQSCVLCLAAHDTSSWPVIAVKPPPPGEPLYVASVKGGTQATNRLVYCLLDGIQNVSHFLYIVLHWVLDRNRFRFGCEVVTTACVRTGFGVAWEIV